MPPKGKHKCVLRRVYPVRYALTSEENPPMAAMPQLGAGLDRASLAPCGYGYTLRKLRVPNALGYVHIYLPKSGECRTYEYAEERFTRKRFKGSKLETVPGGENKSLWLLLPQDEASIQINYAEIPWREDYWSNTILANDARRAERMQTVILDNSGQMEHTAPAGQLGALVEEFRKDKTGLLLTMRECPENALQSEIFRPDMGQMTSGSADTMAQHAWKHSGVTVGRISPEKGESGYPYHEQQLNAVWEEATPWDKDEKARQCDLAPLLVALYDPIGVAGDLARMHLADMEAMTDYAQWYAHPVTSAKYLEALKKTLKNMADEHGVFNPARWRLEASLAFRVPKTGWQALLARHEQDEAAMNGYMTKFCSAWANWLLHEGPDSMVSAFTDYDSAEDAQAMERAFLRGHYAMTLSEHGRDAAVAVYLGAPAPAHCKALLEKVLKAFDTPISAPADDIFGAFMAGWNYLGGRTRQPFGEYEQVLKDRMRKSGAVQADGASTVGQVLETYKMASDHAFSLEEKRLLSLLEEHLDLSAFSIALHYENAKSEGMPSIVEMFVHPSRGSVVALFIKKYNALVSMVALANALANFRPGKDKYGNSTDPADTVAQSLALISAVGSFLMLSAGTLVQIAGRVLLLHLWIFSMVFDFVRSLDIADGAYASLQVSFLVVGSIIGFASLAGATVHPVLLGLAVVVLVLLGVFSRTEAEEWMMNCYWSSAGKHKTGEYGQRTFSYKGWNASRLAVRQQRFREDDYDLKKLFCTPVPGRPYIREMNNEAADLMLLDTAENLFSPCEGRIDVEWRLRSATPASYQTPASTMYGQRIDIILTSQKYRHVLHKELLYSADGTSAAIARFSITRLNLWKIFFSHLRLPPLPHGMSPEYQPAYHEPHLCHLYAASSYKDMHNTYPKNTAGNTEVMHLEIPSLQYISSHGGGEIMQSFIYTGRYSPVF